MLYWHLILIHGQPDDVNLNLCLLRLLGYLRKLVALRTSGDRRLYERGSSINKRFFLNWCLFNKGLYL